MYFPPWFQLLSELVFQGIVKVKQHFHQTKCFIYINSTLWTCFHHIFFSFKTKKAKSLENVQRVSLALLATMLPERPWNGVMVKFGWSHSIHILKSGEFEIKQINTLIKNDNNRKMIMWPWKEKIEALAFPFIATSFYFGQILM